MIHFRNMFKLDLNNKKHAKLIVMFIMNVALFGSFYVDRIQAQAPSSSPATEATTEQSSQPTSETSGDEAVSQTGAEAGSEAAAEKEAASDSSISVWALFAAGGWSMWPLLVASIIGMMVVMERFYYFAVTKVTGKTFQQDLSDSIQMTGLDGVHQAIQTHNELSISSILKEGLDVSRNDPDLFSKGVEREAGGLLARAERGLPVLAAVSTIAPLIGFLGTVSGMIGAFDAIANADTVNAKVVAGGIKEALITTATGLIVGIPAMAFFQYFSSKINGFATEIEQAANSIYKELLRLKANVDSVLR